MFISLLVTQRVALTEPDILPYVHPEGNKEIDDQRRTHGKKRYINKIFTDGACGNAHLFAQPGANAKYVPFNDVP